MYKIRISGLFLAALFVGSILIFAPTSTASLSAVEITPDLTCDFTFSNTEIYINQPVSFATASYSDGGNITDYLWDFGDGSPTETSPNAVHTYTVPGVYTVTHYVTDDYGKMSILNREIIVSEPLQSVSSTDGSNKSVDIENSSLQEFNPENIEGNPLQYASDDVTLKRSVPLAGLYARGKI
ncbi:MAG: PKD domain-containing protein [Methanobacterium sp.]